jgi:hypothetical protein
LLDERGHVAGGDVGRHLELLDDQPCDLVHAAPTVDQRATGRGTSTSTTPSRRSRPQPSRW